MLGKAIWRLRIQENPSATADRGSAPDPAEGAYSAPANPLVGVEGLAAGCPLPKNPVPPLLAFRVSPLLPPLHN